MSQEGTGYQQELTTKLSVLCRKLDDKYDVNNGGCCFLAYCIARELEKRDISFDLVLYDDELPSEFTLYNNIKEHNKDRIPLGHFTVAHYTLRIGNVIINSSEWPDEYQVVKNISCSDIKYIYYHGSWNRLYNRKYNRVISRLVHKFFKDYDKEKC